MQGIFAADASVTAEASEQKPKLESGGRHLETWLFRTTEPEHQTQIRLQIPGEADPEKLCVAIRDASGAWREADHHLFGRYAVAALEPGDDAIALVVPQHIPWLLIAGIIASVTAIGWLYICKKRIKT